MTCKLATRRTSSATSASSPCRLRPLCADLRLHPAGDKLGKKEFDRRGETLTITPCCADRTTEREGITEVWPLRAPFSQNCKGVTGRVQSLPPSAAKKMAVVGALADFGSFSEADTSAYLP